MQTLIHRHRNSLRIGFVPLVDCAPIAVAHELGFFENHDLNVELNREPGWATIRDKMAYGELEAAHAPVGMAFALSWGLGVLQQSCLTGFLLNSNGDAITISRKLSEQGAKDPESLAEHIRKAGNEKPLTFGIPHLFSTHHFLLLQWLRPTGLRPGIDFQTLVLPPSLMASSLAASDIDGYCVGEPFNTIAVTNGDGTILSESADISPFHPEKALIVSRKFDERNSELHIQTIAALSEAAEFCESREGRETAVKVLSSPQYLGMDEELIRSSLFPRKKGSGLPSAESFHVFSNPEVNRPSSDKANWLVSHMRNAGLLENLGGKAATPLGQIFREDIYDEAVSRTLVPA